MVMATLVPFSIQPTISGPQFRLDATAFSDKNREAGIIFLQLYIVILYEVPETRKENKTMAFLGH